MKVVLAGLAMKLPVGERVSQLVLVQLCCDTWAVAVVVVWAVTVSVCGAGGTPPATALNVYAEGVRVRTAPVVAEITLSVTLTVCVPDAVIMEIDPLHVVPAAMPA